MKRKTNKYTHLFKNYFLDKDKYNFILLKLRTTINSVEKYDIIGYYSNISQLVVGIKKHYAFHNVLNSRVEDLIRDLEEIEKVIYRELNMELPFSNLPKEEQIGYLQEALDKLKEEE